VPKGLRLPALIDAGRFRRRPRRARRRHDATKRQLEDAVQPVMSSEEQRPQGDGEPEDSMAEGIEQQAEFEELVREKGDWQAAVDAQQRGERPRKREQPPSSA
jgi:hypothetical protein